MPEWTEQQSIDAGYYAGDPTCAADNDTEIWDWFGTLGALMPSTAAILLKRAHEPEKAKLACDAYQALRNTCPNC